jgi:hypothetical protein
VKKLFVFALLCAVAAGLGVVVWEKRTVSRDVTQAGTTAGKTVSRDILENAERLSRTLENCKTTVKTNLVTR